MSNQSTITWPWLRRMVLDVEGLRDSGGRHFESDGTQKQLRISAQIKKFLQTPAGTTEIRLWNLAPDTRSAFVRKQTKVTLLAGWDDGPNAGLSQVFKGSLLVAQSNRSGTDIVTTLVLQGAREACTTALVIDTWGSGTPVRDIVLGVARQLEDVTVDESLVIGLTGRVGMKGWSTAADAEQTLNLLAREYGFSWTIVDGRFQAIADKDAGTEGVTVRDPYLIEASPVLAGFRRYQRGVTCRTVFNPAIAPGDMITIETALDEACNGRFKVNAVTHNLDCHAANSFTTEFVGFAFRRK